MPDEVNFTDLVALSKIKPDTVVEKFGGMVNSSFFDASNILATLRLKGMIDFTTSFPGTSAITVTEVGKKVLADAEQASGADFDQLDLTLLMQLAAGKKNLQDLSGAVNIRPSDLATHLYKLGKQMYLSYEFRNGIIGITLTEKGFMQSKSGMPQKPQAAAAVPQQGETAKAAPEAQAQQPPTAGSNVSGNEQVQSIMQQQSSTQPAQAPTINIAELEANIRRAKQRRLYGIIAIAVIIIIIVAALMLKLV